MSGARLPGIGSHHSANPKTDEWLTPPEIFAALGPFDLDPCSPTSGPNPYSTAAVHLSALDDGLTHPWQGLVWCNPPYSDIAPWMRRMAEHGNGIALVFARAETAWWFDSVWPHASRILFLKGRLTFLHGDGTASKVGHNSGGPSVLIAYGPTAANRLDRCGLPGALTYTLSVTSAVQAPSPYPGVLASTSGRETSLVEVVEPGQVSPSPVPAPTKPNNEGSQT